MIAFVPECAAGIWLFIPFAVLLAAVSLDIYLWRGVKNGFVTIANTTAVKVGLLMVHVAAFVGVFVLTINRMACQ